MAALKNRKQHYRRLVVGFGLMLGVMRPGIVSADVVAVGEINQKVVTLNNVAMHNGVISGEIVNRSNQEVRDVELLIRHTWQWSNEFQPGNGDPGMASYQIVDKVIRPGESVRFTFNDVPTSPPRSDGQFQTMVSVAGFTEIFRNP